MTNGIPMEVIIDRYNKYNKALEKAKRKYKDAIIRRYYQNELLLNTRGSEKEKVEFKRKISQTEICLLEDVFGSRELNKGE